LSSALVGGVGGVVGMIFFLMTPRSPQRLSRIVPGCV
jgi:hypothetical protein